MTQTKLDRMSALGDKLNEATMEIARLEAQCTRSQLALYTVRMRKLHTQQAQAISGLLRLGADMTAIKTQMRDKAAEAVAEGTNR